MAEEKSSDVPSLTERARIFATERHLGTFKKNKTHKPFIMHPAEVAEFVRLSGGSEAEIVAAWLHDTVEDTSTTLDEIEESFGREVRIIVDGLTDLPGFAALPLLLRKTRQARRVSSKSASVKRVKISDQISNISLVAIDPPIGWNKQKCRDYAEGARMVAEGCRGVSDYLDTEFERIYQEMKQAWEVP